ncbi:MAG: hydrolase [Parcubacteria group bacterium]|nr:hydrolase [Parcubacteria group bacterium]
MPKVSAGLIMYRKREGKTEVLLVHPGGPLWKNKDYGSWDIVKGERNEGETDLLEVAKREFTEETGFTAEGVFIPLGMVKMKSGKEVHAWAFEGNCDPAAIISNMIQITWPPFSGKKIEIPEVDRGEFYEISEAKEKVYQFLVPFIDTMERNL